MIWGDYHPSGWPSHQTAVIHAGNGQNFIYSNDTVNYVFTGTNPRTVVHAHEGSGVIHCENPAHRGLHQPPRPAPLPPPRLPPHQLLSRSATEPGAALEQPRAQRLELIVGEPPGAELGLDVQR